MANLSFVWPIEDYWNHYQVRSVLERQDISEHWNKISSAIRGISWDDILNRHTAEYSDRMSISLALTDELNEALIEAGAQSKIPIFSDNNKSSKPFLIEHKLGSIAVDFSFGHYNLIAWKLARLATAIMPNEKEMGNQCKVGVLILPQEELRKIGKFDSPSNWERAVDYIQYMGGQWQAPLLLLGIKNPGTFEIIDNGKKNNPRSTVVKSR
jgi:hypothetical protein